LQEEIELMAGKTPGGQSLIERIPVEVKDDQCRLIRSPAFAAGAASGDLLAIDRSTGKFEVVSRSGNLAIRIYGPMAKAKWIDPLCAAMERAGAQIDTRTARLLVFTAHVSLGFTRLEAILDDHVSAPATWQYGNVWHPETGEPLNWWQSILAER